MITSRRPSRMITSHRAQRRLLRTPGSIVWALVATGLLVWLPFLLSTRQFFGIRLTNDQMLGIGLPQINLTLIAIVAAIALNLLLGTTGLISMAHAAFFAIGAMVGGFAGTQLGLPFLLVLVLSGIVGAIVGVLFGLPSLRLSGLYLMLSTFALHFIVLYAFYLYQLAAFGPTGIPFETPTIGPIELNNETNWYFFLMVVVVLVILGSRSLLRSRPGRALVAIRDHDIAAGSLGVNVPVQRLWIFALSAFIVSFIGAAAAYYQRFIDHEAYTIAFVVGYFAMVIIGGLGSIPGAVFGALLWTLLPHIIQTGAKGLEPVLPGLGTWLSKYQGQIVAVTLGVIILVILRYQPKGLDALWRVTKRSVTRWPYRD